MQKFDITTGNREQFGVLRVPKVDPRILRDEQPQQLRSIFYFSLALVTFVYWAKHHWQCRQDQG